MKVLTIIILVFLGINLGLCGDIEEKKTQAKESAQNVYQSFQSTVSSAGILKERYINPLISNATMTTIDQSKSFTAQLLCPASGEFLTIMAQPTATGDLNVLVFYDTNHDGRMDMQFNINNISIICANGYGVCDPGTLQGCTYYTLSYDTSSKQLKVQEVDLTSLGGCYCINNFCGQDLFWRNMNYTLVTLGGMIAQAFQREDRSLVISDSRIEGTTIKFYAQSLSECSQVGGSSAVKGLTQLYDTPSLISGLASYTYETESERSGSPAYLVTQMASKIGESYEIQSCVIKKVVKEKRWDFLRDPVLSGSQCGGGPFFLQQCGSNCVYFTFFLYSPTSTYTMYITLTPEFREAIRNMKVNFCTNTYAPYPCFDDDFIHRYYINGQLAGSTGGGDCEPCNIWVSLDYTLLTGSTNLFTAYNQSGKDPGYGCRPVYVYFYFSTPLTGCGIGDNYVEDGCASLQERQDCTLWEEIIDGVKTVQNGQKTGLYPFARCQNFCDGQTVICDSKWVIERKYKCKASGPDLASLEKRGTAIVSSLNYEEGTGTLRFDDIRYEKGSWQSYPNRQFMIGSYGKPDDCEMICKVKGLSLGRELEVDPTLRSKAREEFIYKPCRVNSNNEYYCPLDPGEVIVADCQCHTNFPQTLTALQAMRLAGQDFVCSSGVEKGL